MPKSKKTTALNNAAKSLKATEKRLRAQQREIERSGRIRNPGTGRYVKPTLPNIRKIEREILKDVKQNKKTLNAAADFVQTIAGFFKDKKKASKKGAVKPSPKTSKNSTSKNTSGISSVKPSSKTSTRKSTSKNSQGSTSNQPSKRDSSGTKTRKNGASKSPIKSSKREQPPIPAPLQPSRNRIYEVSELPEAFRTDTANETLEAIEESAADYNALLKPGDVFGGRVGYYNENGHLVGGYTHHIFRTIEEYIQYMQQYRVVKELGDSPSHQVEVLDLLQIIRFKAPKKVYTGKVPSFNANVIGWSNKILSYNRKKDASKKAYKKKMQQRDKDREKKFVDSEMKLRVQVADLQGRLLKQELDKKYGKGSK